MKRFRWYKLVPEYLKLCQCHGVAGAHIMMIGGRRPLWKHAASGWSQCATVTTFASEVTVLQPSEGPGSVAGVTVPAELTQGTLTHAPTVWPCLAPSTPPPTGAPLRAWPQAAA
eukprot:3158587-Rhodomonas_salina.4